MDSRILKILAIVFMTVDHVGLVLFPQITYFRIIGRLAFPLFAFLIAYGSTKTRSGGSYFLRLIAFAVFLQIAWVLLPVDKPEFNNIFFTLALGEFAILLIKFLKRDAPLNTNFGKFFFVVIASIFVGLVCLLGWILGVDYGAPGVLLIVLFYVSLSKKETIQDKMTGVISRIFEPLIILVIFNLVFVLFASWTIQWYSLFSVVFLWFFIDRKIKAKWFEKYAFYFYYPLHFVVLYLVGAIF